MPTIKEIKAELDMRGIKYPANALKADLEKLYSYTETEVIENRKGTMAERPEDKRVLSGFIDPNANSDTQA